MTRNWTFGQRLGGGFALVVALVVVIGIVATYALRSVVASKDQVIVVNSQLLLDAERLTTQSSEVAEAVRGFLLTGDETFVGRVQDSRDKIASILGRLRTNVTADDERRAVEAVDRDNSGVVAAIDRVVALRRTSASPDAVVRAFADQVSPPRRQLSAAIDAFRTLEERRLAEARQTGTDVASTAERLVIAIVIVISISAAAFAFFLSRSLGRQLGNATGQVKSSSAELQAAANQQATGAKEQATAMSEITTTIGELLATSRQIAESAQRVAQIAEGTAAAARTGEAIVPTAHESIIAIRRQVDLIVNHMLELGKKSQQIGAVLDIVSELAEQTNILAINATIEAAGAGEAGKRFAVVADEIRKLADRVGGSAKEIRGLIDDIRSAVNTTVMATEGGSKAVDAGTQQFAEVAAAFKQIADLVTTTTETAREIELSTKQQATAVEQLNVAISNVAQATKETEASAGQTLQTASQLAGLSTELLRLVRPAVSA